MKIKEGLVTVGLIGGALWAATEYYDWTVPACLRDPSFDHCLPNWKIGLPGFSDTDEQPYTARVRGGITEVHTLPLRVPLFESQVELNPLEIKKDGNTVYEEIGRYAVSTSLDGRIMMIDQGSGPDRNIFVVGVDDKGTPEQTDDSIRPIDLNDFKMVTEQGAHIRTYDASLQSEYDTCVEELKAGDPNSQGCIISGINDHDKNVPATVLDNIRAQHISYDGCIVRTLSMTSNVILGGVTDVIKWDNTLSQETVTIGDVAAQSLKERVASEEGVTEDQVFVYMATDEFGNASQWNPGDKVDLSMVEHLSNGDYEAPDVYVPEYCGQGSFKTESTVAERTVTIKKMFGEGNLTNAVWLAQFNEYKQVVLPTEIANGTFNADGQFVDGVSQQAVTVEEG